MQSEIKNFKKNQKNLKNNWNFFFIFYTFFLLFEILFHYFFVFSSFLDSFSCINHKKLKNKLKFFFEKNCIFLYFKNFSFLIEFLHPKPWPTICLMSQLYDYIWKKHGICIVFAHQGLQKPHSVLRYPVLCTLEASSINYVS